MTTIETFEAKTHLTRLLGQVSKGERILITNRGRPVALLVPPDADARGDVEATVKDMLAARDEHGPTIGKSRTTRRMREEGKRR
jgi:prevent-host-death family protein